MNYEKAKKRLKLKFKQPRWNDDIQATEFFTREYISEIGTVKIYYNRGWKYHVSIYDHDKDRFQHKHFEKKEKLIDFLDSIGAEYVQKSWEE